MLAGSHSLSNCFLIVFQQFERSLSTDDEKLTLDEPLTSEDCTFLRQAYFSCNQDSVSLELTGLTKNDLQGFGIVFKALDGKNVRLVNFRCQWEAQ